MNKFLLMVVISLAVGGLVYLNDPASRSGPGKGADAAPADNASSLKDKITAWFGGDSGSSGSTGNNGNNMQPAASSPSWASTSKNITNTTDQGFKNDVLGANIPVLVEFWMANSSACKDAEPEITKLADQLSGKMKIVTVEIQACPKTTKDYGVAGVPALFVFEGGRVSRSMSGAGRAEQIRRELKLPDGPLPIDESTRVANMTPINTTDRDFDNDVMKSLVPVVVEFWRPGCPYCVQVDPELVNLASGLSGKVRVVKVNIWESREIATRFSITGVPTMFLFENGKFARKLGGRTALEIKDELGYN